MNRSELSLKVPRHLRWPIFTPTSSALPRLDRRQHALVRLSHPHIGPMYAYRESGQPRVGCELLSGATLADRLRWRRRAPYNLSETLELLVPVASALEHTHGQGVAHGNLHPGAIVYLSSGAMLTAFAGTAAPGPAIYRAPEQLSDAISPRADVYALAAIARELLTGYPPSIQASDASGLPPGTDAVLVRALSRQPRQRHRSPQSLIEDLQAAQRRSRQRAKASRWRAGGIVGITLLMLALSVGAIVGLLV